MRRKRDYTDDSRPLRKYCGICGRPLEECEGECQDWITLKQKTDYLKSLEEKKEA